MTVAHRLMYTASIDGTAKCWVTEHGDNTVTYKGHDLSVTLVRFYKGLGNNHHDLGQGDEKSADFLADQNGWIHFARICMD